MADTLGLWLIALSPVAMTSCLVAALIVQTKDIHIKFTAKGHAGLEVQSVHLHPTPRIGGLALFAGLLVALGLMPHPSFAIQLLLAMIPVFIAGFLEDIRIAVRPKYRLVAAGISAILAIQLTGYTVSQGLGPWLDPLFALPGFALLFTVFITAGICHAMNLIDGLNGLAMSVAILAALASAHMAFSVGDSEVAALCVAVFCATLGLFVLNYPFGKIFLGDAGAYGLGFLIALVGTSLLARNPEISPWAVLLTVLWPCMDTVAAILRRIAKKQPIGAADKLHFHHIVKRLIEASLRGSNRPSRANPLASFVMFPLLAAPPLLAPSLAEHPIKAFLAVLLFMIFYGLSRALLLLNFRRFGAFKSVVFGPAWKSKPS